MARTTTANYETERAKRATAPVYIARFFHVPVYGSGLDYGFSRDFATATVASPTVTKLLSLGRPRGNTQTVEPELGRSSNGVLELRIQDTNGETLRYLSNVPLRLNGAPPPHARRAGGGARNRARAAQDAPHLSAPCRGAVRQMEAFGVLTPVNPRSCVR